MSELHKKKICIKSPAKINLHLEVVGKRDDGFHELAMIMQNIDLSDHLEFEINHNGLIKLKSDSQQLCLESDNLIVKSANLLRDISNKDLGANIFLKKNIPIGAGLAGGSSNAAATLIALNKLWGLNLDYNKIFSLSQRLGSDVPFFIRGGSQLCFGRGEILEEFKPNLEYGVLLLKNPNVSISTSEVYRRYSNKFSKYFDLSPQNIDNIRNKLRKKIINHMYLLDQSNRLKNDLQLVVENENDSVKIALMLLSNLKNCLKFSMSGSGPTCFALFKDFETANESLEENYKLFQDNGFDSWVCKLLDKGVSYI